MDEHCPKIANEAPLPSLSVFSQTQTYAPYYNPSASSNAGRHHMLARCNFPPTFDRLIADPDAHAHAHAHPSAFFVKENVP